MSTKVSTNKASKIFKHLRNGILATPSPSQSVLYGAILKEAVQLNQQLHKIYNWKIGPYPFDEKRIDDNEHQEVILKNKRTEVQLDATAFS